MINIRFALTAALLSVGSATLVSAQRPATPQRMHRNQALRSDSAHRSMVARGLRRQLFKGITLSDAEKANLKAVRQKYGAQLKTLREQAKPQLQAAREARQRGDTAALKALWKKSAPQREQTKQLLVAERNDLRAALTSANQAKFDANAAQLEARLVNRVKRAGKAGIHRPPTTANR